MIGGGECQVVGGSERLLAEIRELDPCDAIPSLGDRHSPAVDVERLRWPLVQSCQPPEHRAQAGACLHIRRHEIEASARQPVLPIVALCLQHDEIEPLRDQADERQEQATVEAVLVELGGNRIRRRYDDDASVQQLREQTAQDHRVGDVGDEQLVEAEQPRRRRNLSNDGDDRIGHARLARCGKALMHLLHEGVEVHPALGLEGDRAVEQVHEHRLAATDLTCEVKPTGRLGVAPPKHADQPARSVEIGQSIGEQLQLFCCHRLSTVGLESAVRDHRAIAVEEALGLSGLGHGRWLQSPRTLMTSALATSARCRGSVGNTLLGEPAAAQIRSYLSRSSSI